MPGFAKLFATRRPVKVEGTIDGRPWAATLMPSSTGPHRIPLTASLRTLIGTSRADEEAFMELRRLG